MTKEIAITYNEFNAIVAAKNLYEDELEIYDLNGGNKKSDDYKLTRKTFTLLRTIVERWKEAPIAER